MADADIIVALEAEEARLDTELRKLPLYRRLEAVRTSIRTLKDAYDPGQADTTSGPSSRPEANEATGTDQNANTQKSSGFRSNARPGSMTTRITEVAEALFRQTGRRLQSSALMRELAERGIETPKGKKPQSVVASIMSHNPKFDNGFDSHGVGYGLREWSAEASGHGGNAEDKTAAPEKEAAV